MPNDLFPEMVPSRPSDLDQARAKYAAAQRALEDALQAEPRDGHEVMRLTNAIAEARRDVARHEQEALRR